MATHSCFWFLGTHSSSQVTCEVTIKGLFGSVVSPNNTVIQTSATNEAFLSSFIHSNPIARIILHPRRNLRPAADMLSCVLSGSQKSGASKTII